MALAFTQGAAPHVAIAPLPISQRAAPAPSQASCGSKVIAVSGLAAVAATVGHRRIHRRGAQKPGALVVRRAEVMDAVTVEPIITTAEEPTPTEAPRKMIPFACPVCQKSLAMSATGAVCKRCRLAFMHQADGGFTDFTVDSARPLEEAASTPPSPSKKEESSFLKNLPFVDVTDKIAGALGLPQSEDVEALGRELLKEPGRLLNRPGQPFGTSTFQNPLVSFAYERGWRRSFAASGFPGPEKEFEFAQNFFSDAGGPKGDVLLDASCGSGLFSRRFAMSGDYEAVVALDYSEAMLRQVDDFSTKELGAGYANPPPGGAGLTLVRADISRLPFESNSLGGVHAGAAIHCWPSPTTAVAEVARVLRPGGVFVLSTFMPRGPLAAAGMGPQGNGAAYRWWTEEDLRKLTRSCGLMEFEAIKRDPAFIMVRVKKPLVEDSEV